jgi:transposase
MNIDQWLQERFAALSPHLDEKQRRLMAATDARFLGRGGVSRVSRATGLSRPTIYKGMAELESHDVPVDRIRRVGGGRKKVSEKYPSIPQELEFLVDPVTRGDPMSPLRWTCKSTRQLARALKERGYTVSYRTVGTMLKDLGYSLQANAKTLEGTSHPDRDEQFQYINDLVKHYQSQALPVISVDTKKKELVGQYKNGGREWRPVGDPEKVNVYDFKDPVLGKAIPYGIYDVGKNLGWVNVGCDYDTASFAVESINRWWHGMGRVHYPKAKQLLICADSGGSNGYRIRLWKVELQRFADATGLEVTVCHLPPGTSKWNKIEHRLFSHISMNWRGHPLVSHEVIVELIGATTTESGLAVTAQLDTNKYPTKVKVTKEQMLSVKLQPHQFHGEWNYTISPQRT